MFSLARFVPLATFAIVTAATTACLPRTKPVATLISPRELGVATLQLKMTAPEGVKPFGEPTDAYVTPDYDGGVRVSFEIDGRSGNLVLAPTSTMKTVDEQIEEAEHTVKNYSLIDKGTIADAGWFLMYSEYVPAHVYKDAYGEQQFANAEQVQKLVSRVRINDAWYTCKASASTVEVVKVAAKLCGSVEPWTPPGPAAAPNGDRGATAKPMRSVGSRTFENVPT